MRAVILAGILAAGMLANPAIAADPSETANRQNQALTTPQLIERAVRQGEVNRSKGDLFLAYALASPRKLPPAYRSPAPWDGTLPLLHLRERLKTMPPGPQRAQLKEALSPAANCGGQTGGADILDTAHFHIHYTAANIGGGLTISDYGASLETSWSTEVTSFGWAAPPISGGLYLVVVDGLGSGLYGYVTTTGNAGNNPNTSWNEGDAQYSCMALNENYTAFPGSPQQAMDATTAHEFNHSIQFGYGALTGANAADDALVEGGATWMEDEVYDDSNDNHNYLWPSFTQDMGQYTASPYPYWITYRGLTERYGAGVAGGGEQVMQDAWEAISQSATNIDLNALNTALTSKGTTLADAYHAYAVAVKFNKACAGGYIYPYCFEEGPAYVANAGPTIVQGTISSVGGSFSGSIRDNYALNWVQLPSGAGTYNVTLTNNAAGGQLRGSVVCDTGAALVVNALPLVVGSGASTTLTGFDSSSCLSSVAVMTNQAQTAPDPSSPGALRAYQLSTGTGGPGSPTITVNDVSVTEGGAGTTTTATFTASLSAPSAQTVTVNYATADGGGPKSPGATAPSDYSATSGTVTFAPGDTAEPIPVTVNGDNTVEPNEPFNVVLSGPTNASIADGTGVGTIVNDDSGGGGGCTKNCPPGGQTLSISDATVTEPDAGTVVATFVVTLSPSSTGTVTVNFATANGPKFGATAPSDYTSTSGTLTFSPGETTKTIEVSVNGDTVPEANETFTVNLSAASGAAIADGSGLGTILNDD